MSPHFVDSLGGLRSILAAVHDVVLVLDEDRRIRYINRLEEGYTMDDVLGAPAESFIQPGSKEVSERALDAAYERGETSDYEVAIPSPSGPEIWYRSRLFPIRRDGRTVAVVIMASNVTELKRAQAELEDLRRLLPVCSWCDRIQNEDGSWEELADYLKRETGTGVSHGLCPDCFQRQMSGLDEKETKAGGAG